MLNKKALLMVFFFLLLTACGYRSNEKYLIKHPAILKAKVAQCRAVGVQSLKNPECRFTMDVFNQAVIYSKELVANPYVFGKKIIRAQVTLGKIEEQIEKGGRDSKALLKQRDNLQRQINIMRTLIAESQNM